MYLGEMGKNLFLLKSLHFDVLQEAGRVRVNYANGRPKVHIQAQRTK